MSYLLIALLVIVAVVVVGFAYIIKGPAEVKFEPKPFEPAAYPFKQEFMQVDGAKVCAIEEGAGDQAIIFIHGLGGCIGNWEHSIRHFAKKMRVLSLDLPGFGLSERRDDIPYGIEYFSDLVIKFMDKKGIKKAAVVGNSMGGHITSFIAWKYPDRVSHAILSDPAGMGINSPNWMVGLPVKYEPIISRTAIRWARHYAINKPEQLRKVIAKGMKQDAKSGASRSGIYDHKEARTAKMIQENMEFILNMIPTEEFPKYIRAFLRCAASIYSTPMNVKAYEIKPPTLIVWGREDGLVPLKSGYKFNEAIKGSVMAVFANCGHVPMVEKAEEFNEAVESFVTSKPIKQSIPVGAPLAAPMLA